MFSLVKLFTISDIFFCCRVSPRRARWSCWPMRATNWSSTCSHQSNPPQSHSQIIQNHTQTVTAVLVPKISGRLAAALENSSGLALAPETTSNRAQRIWPLPRLCPPLPPTSQSEWLLSDFQQRPLLRRSRLARLPVSVIPQSPPALQGPGSQFANNDIIYF